MTILVCAGVLAIALLLQPGREPVYQGHTLSGWTYQYWANSFTNPARSDEAQRAIQRIGTNALPTLLEWIRYDEPPWRTRLINRTSTYTPPDRAPTLFQAVLQKLVMSPAGRHARQAPYGFEALGTVAHSAAVELLELSASKSAFVSRNATSALMNMQGQKALILAAGLTNSDSAVRLRAAQCIGRVLYSYSTHAPADPDLDPFPAVPFLTNALSDPDTQVRRAATNTLRATVPSLINALNDPDINVRGAATNALRRIVPHALGKDGKFALPSPIGPDTVYWLTNTLH